ncbi:hypothetical protein Rhow_008113 [Rhodococcus wratislaviensis]|uniref:Uncharacterized protein n=1 Tax=Rhodococcus wratislaviensis TaxID=44752 RepID=A0A402CJU0_RHOWR|nr:hypothetical protein Rhow_008113 [Rhodococcus wratislaviensis]
MSVDSDRIRLRFGGKIVSIPDSAAAEVSHLLESEKSAANQLPGDLDEQGRVVLIRRLVREGLLTICPPSDPAPDTVAPLRDSNH